jgi:bifunctional DNA-binding transcriptional regulator/antitoxin component of YhaV-PrlF toxin-antitoxin module
MITVTLSSKGQLTIPRQLRQVLGLAAGARLQASIDAQGRLVLVPSRYEPEDLFRHRPPVDRVMSLEDMEQAIAASMVSPDP